MIVTTTANTTTRVEVESVGNHTVSILIGGYHGTAIVGDFDEVGRFVAELTRQFHAVRAVAEVTK